MAPGQLDRLARAVESADQLVGRVLARSSDRPPARPRPPRGFLGGSRFRPGPGGDPARPRRRRATGAAAWRPVGGQLVRQ